MHNDLNSHAHLLLFGRKAQNQKLHGYYRLSIHLPFIEKGLHRLLYELNEALSLADLQEKLHVLHKVRL